LICIIIDKNNGLYYNNIVLVTDVVNNSML